ncbi:MAG: hypothetical protein CVU98_01620 [Firmicutes bacterium HGW-Firmicutes-3]|jgi:AcrR family transcriptional regulator|nr:MAG: hypothetical protein CVU98_01620 [Firmicutes bacterium HGW-Firmicutes-3]
MNPIIDEEVKIDRRVRKTKKAIKNALLTLASDKNLSEITVTDISDIADINRKTFYAYYKDVYELIDDIENDIISKLIPLISEQDITKIITEPYQMFYILTNIIVEDINFYTLFLSSTVIDTTLAKVKNVFRDYALSALNGKTNVSDEMLIFIFEYIAGGLITTYKEWFRSDQSVSLEDLSKQITIIVSSGIRTIVK